MSDALYIPDDNKVRAELRYQQSRSRLVALGDEISSRKPVRVTAVVAAERVTAKKVAAFTSVLRPAKKRRMAFPKAPSLS